MYDLSLSLPFAHFGNEFEVTITCLRPQRKPSVNQLQVTAWYIIGLYTLGPPAMPLLSSSLCVCYLHHCAIWHALKCLIINRLNTDTAAMS